MSDDTSDGRSGRADRLRRRRFLKYSGTIGAGGLGLGSGEAAAGQDEADPDEDEEETEAEFTIAPAPEEGASLAATDGPTVAPDDELSQTWEFTIECAAPSCPPTTFGVVGITQAVHAETGAVVDFEVKTWTQGFETVERTWDLGTPEEWADRAGIDDPTGSWTLVGTMIVGGVLVDQATEFLEVEELATLELENVRIVQTVENTRVEDPSGGVLYTEPDPDLASDRNGAVVFDLSVNDPEDISDPVTVTMVRTETSEGGSRTRTDEFDLTPAELERFDLSRTGIGVLDHIDDEVPVFEVDPLQGETRWELQSVDLKFEGPDIETVEETLERGGDYEVSESHVLRIGFIAIQDPGLGVNYGSSNDGLPSETVRKVFDAIQFLEFMYPVRKVVAYLHDRPILGVVPPKPGGPGLIDLENSALFDATNAREVLDMQLPITEPETVHRNGTIPASSGFDETVLITPDDYFEFHTGSSTLGGRHFVSENTQARAASIVEEDDARSLTAHEITHHFTDDLYRGPADSHPMAQRAEVVSQNPTRWDLQFAHARHQESRNDDEHLLIADDPGVLLTRFHLEDGRFDTTFDRPSVMSYARPPGWADSRMFQRLLDQGFEPAPPERNPGSGNVNSQANGRGPVVSGVALVADDGSVTVETMRLRRSHPMANDPDGNVDFVVRADDGTTLQTATTVDEWTAQPTAQEGRKSETVTGVVPYVVSYPEEAAEIVIEREGTTTTVDPLARLLDGATDRVVDDSFVRNPRQRRTALANKLNAVGTQIRNGAYRGARNKLRNDVRERIEQWLQGGVDVPGNFYTKSELLALIDEVIDRLETLEGSADGSRGSGGNGGRDSNGGNAGDR